MLKMTSSALSCNKLLLKNSLQVTRASLAVPTSVEMNGMMDEQLFGGGPAAVCMFMMRSGSEVDSLSP